MIVVMSSKATEAQIQGVLARLEGKGLQGHRSGGEERTVIGVIGTRFEPQLGEQLEMLPGVSYRHSHQQAVQAGESGVPALPTLSCAWGTWRSAARDITVMAGPCSVESLDQMMETAIAVKAAGATVLRGGAYKPRTSPYSFQGLGEEGLQILAEVRRAHGTEDHHRGDGARAGGAGCRSTRTSFRSARAACRISRCSSRWGASNKPVLLKRGWRPRSRSG